MTAGGLERGTWAPVGAAALRPMDGENLRVTLAFKLFGDELTHVLILKLKPYAPIGVLLCPRRKLICAYGSSIAGRVGARSGRFCPRARKITFILGNFSCPGRESNPDLRFRRPP